MILHRIEAVAVTLATTVATGTFRGVNESISEIIGFPIDRIGVLADLVAGACAFWKWRHKDGHDHHIHTKGAG